ncbi:MAG: WXG100 family type VII secretion target [Pseudonocardiaceae bacterium]
MTGFDIDPEQMRQQGREIEQLGVTSADRLRSLRDLVAGDGAPWGADEAGAAFGAAYQELVTVADEVLRLFSDGIESVGHHLQQHADEVHGVDEDSRDLFTTIAGELGDRT